jgi:hypothetical protein
MESYSFNIEEGSQTSEVLVKARKEFVALIKRLNNPISDTDHDKLTDPEIAEFNPNFSYPTLFDLDEIKITEKRNTIHNNLTIVKDVEQKGYSFSIEEEFDMQKAQIGFMNLELISLAQAIQSPSTLNISKTAEKFISLNERLVGAVDEDLYQGLVNYLNKATDKIPQNHRKASLLASELKEGLPPFSGNQTLVSLDDDIFEKYQEVYRLLFGQWLDRIISEKKVKYDSSDIAQIFRNALDDMRFDDWIIEIDENTNSMKVSMKYKKITIPVNRSMSFEEISKKVVHETGHIIRGWNGSYISSKAENGLPDYLEAEEGLMSYGEEFISGKRQPNITYIERYIGAGFMTGTLNDGTKKDFSQVFAKMWRARLLLNYTETSMEEDITNEDIKSAKVESLMNAKRLFRGGNGQIPGVGWTKDKVYYEGYVKLTKLLKDFANKIGLENIDGLFVAKFDPTNDLHKKYIGSVV